MLRNCCPWISSVFSSSKQSQRKVAPKAETPSSEPTVQATKETTHPMTFTKMLLFPPRLSSIGRRSQQEIKVNPQVLVAETSSPDKQPTTKAQKGLDQGVQHSQKRILNGKFTSPTTNQNTNQCSSGGSRPHILVNHGSGPTVREGSYNQPNNTRNLPALIQPRQPPKATKSFSQYLLNMFSSKSVPMPPAMSPITKKRGRGTEDYFESPAHLLEEKGFMRGDTENDAPNRHHKQVKNNDNTFVKANYSSQKRISSNQFGSGHFSIIQPQQVAPHDGNMSNTSLLQASGQQQQRVKGFKTLRYGSLLKEQPSQLKQSQLNLLPAGIPKITQETKDSGPGAIQLIQSKKKVSVSQTSLEGKEKANSAGVSGPQLGSKEISGSKNGNSLVENSILEQIQDLGKEKRESPHARKGSPDKFSRREKRKSLVMHSSAKKNFLSLLPPPKATKSLRNLPPKSKPNRSSRDLEEDDPQEESRMNVTLNTTYIKKTSVLGAKKSSREIGYSIKQNCTKIDQYVIVSKLGAGNCGEVHLAVDSVSKNKFVTYHTDTRQLRKSLSSS